MQGIIARFLPFFRFNAAYDHLWGSKQVLESVIGVKFD